MFLKVLNYSWLNPWMGVKKANCSCTVITLLAFLKWDNGVHASRRAERVEPYLGDSKPQTSFFNNYKATF